MEIASFIPIILAALAVFIIMKTVRIVPQGSEWTLENFGRYAKTLKPGLAFVIPFYQRISNKMDMRERMIDIPSQEVITKDNVMVTADAVVFIQVIDARMATYEVSNLENAIQNLCLTNVRTVVGSMDLDEVLSKRDQINAQLLTVIDQATDSWGSKVVRIEIKDLSPPHDITQANARHKLKRKRLRWFQRRLPVVM